MPRYRSKTQKWRDSNVIEQVPPAPSGLVGFYTAPPIPQPAAITAPSGGGTVDTQARAAIVAVLNLLSQAAGGNGLTK